MYANTKDPYTNNKPWITSDVKSRFNKKKRVFKVGYQPELRHLQRELKAMMEGGTEIAGKQLEGGLGWDENNHRLQEGE